MAPRLRDQLARNCSPHQNHPPRHARRAAAIGVAVEEVHQAAEKAIPLGRSGTIDELGRVAAFLLSDAAAYITGASLAVDGGALKSA